MEPFQLVKALESCKLMISAAVNWQVLQNVVDHVRSNLEDNIYKSLLGQNGYA